MDNIVFNKNCSLLQERFPSGHFIPIKDAAGYLGLDHRTLEARKDFPLVTAGNRKGVYLVRFAKWLSEVSS